MNKGDNKSNKKQTRELRRIKGGKGERGDAEEGNCRGKEGEDDNRNLKKRKRWKNI
jgi:hypothetical protein